MSPSPRYSRSTSRSRLGRRGVFAVTLRKGSSQMLDIAKTTKLVDQRWSDEVIPTLVE